MIKEKLHNYFYKTTNLVNGKYYYGIHSTENLDDGYMGSGVYLNRAIKKYGIENFIKEIIADYPTRKEASDHERLVVTLELIHLEECYNSKTGGENENTFKHSEETKEKMRLAQVGRVYSPERNKKVSDGKLGNTHFLGKTHSEETKQKMRDIMSEKYGNGNHPLKGIKKSDEVRAKMSLAQRKCAKYGSDNPRTGQKRSKEVGEKISKTNMGRKNSSETIERMKVAKQKWHQENTVIRVKCLILGTVYNSIADASRNLNKTIKYVRYRLDNDKWPDWVYYKGD